MDQTDEQLISEYSQGDRHALETLFHRYKRPVFNFALRILDNQADAEDVTSEVFFQLFHRRYVYNRTAKFSTWLFAVARNACITRIRKRKNMVSFWFQNNDSDTYEARDVADNTPSTSEQMKQAEQKSLVRKAVRSLPLEQKEALILREYLNTSYADIAQVLNCSVEKVKVLIFRARERLRAELTPLLNEEGGTLS